ncbi:MAG: amidase family protein [Myxococcota bacterium]
MELWELGLVEMQRRLQAGSLSAAELIEAHIRRIETRDSGVHAMVHRFFESARAEAQAADAARKSGDARPLLGLPITVKESIETKGLPSTMGVRARQSQIAERDAVVVAIAKEQGAIVLGKTNIAQLLLSHESENPLFGRTLNPWDPARVPGGSSGGESAAIAAGMSPAGIGTDIGGSIRVPATFTGVAGLKPTNDRWSNLGAVGGLPGQEIIRGQTGPMARNAEDVALLFRAVAIARQTELDPAVPPVPQRTRSLEGLKVGVVESDGWLEPAASVKRAVREAAGHLEALGIAVVPYAPPEISRIIDTYFGALSSDGGKTVDRVLDGEPAAAQLAGLRRIAKLPQVARASLAMLLGMRGEQRAQQLINAVKEKPVAELWRLAAERTRLRVLSARAMAAAGLDAILCPAHATPALRHLDSADFALGGFPSMLYNFLNFPAGVIPLTRVRADETNRSARADRLDRRAASVEEGSAGLPIGVQIVGRPWDEELVLELMIAVEARAKASPEFPRTPV